MDSSEIIFNLEMLNGNNFSNLPSQYAFEYFSNKEYVNLGTTVANFCKISWNSFSSILALIVNLKLMEKMHQKLLKNTESILTKNMV